MTGDSRALWDGEAARFDDEPDHGLRDPAVRAAWAGLLLPLLPAAPARVADLGCGTGSLAVLLAQAGHDVTGVDFSPRMLALARAKAAAAGVDARFAEGDAADPPLADATCDAVLVRHVLWALPDPAAALRRWNELLVPGGLLLLVEGRWSSDAGLTAAAAGRLLRDAGRKADIRPLDDPALWGRPIDDERYLVESRC